MAVYWLRAKSLLFAGVSLLTGRRAIYIHASESQYYMGCIVNTLLYRIGELEMCSTIRSMEQGQPTAPQKTNMACNIGFQTAILTQQNRNA